MFTLPAKIIFCAFVLALAFDYLFFDVSHLGINVLVAEIFFLGISFFLSKLSGHGFSHRAWSATACALVFSAVFAVRTSDVSLSVAMLGFLISNFFFASFVMGHTGSWRHPFEMFLSAFMEPAYRLLSRFSIFGALRIRGMNAKRTAVLKGVLVLIPIFLIFLVLLSSADQLFGSYVQRIFSQLDLFFDPELVFRHVFFVGFFTVLFSLFFAGSFWQRFTQTESSELTPRFILESQIILGGIIILFALFLFVQAYALFGGEAALRELGLTYAQYARQGFFQLIVVSILVMLIVLTLRLVHGEKCKKLLLALHLILIAQTVLLLISAFSRLYLYIDAYGFTPHRLFAFWVIISLGVLLILTFGNILLQVSQKYLLSQGLIIVAVSSMMFAWTPIDVLTVQYNIARFERCEQTLGQCKIDAQMFLSLSEEAYPLIKEFLDSAREQDIQGLISPQPSQEAYCTARSVEPFTLDYATLLLEDLSMRQSLQIFYSGELFDLRGLAGWDWQAWNLSRARLPDRYMDEPIFPDWLAKIPVCP